MDKWDTVNDNNMLRLLSWPFPGSVLFQAQGISYGSHLLCHYVVSPSHPTWDPTSSVGRRSHHEDHPSMGWSFRLESESHGVFRNSKSHQIYWCLLARKLERICKSHQFLVLTLGQDELGNLHLISTLSCDCQGVPQCHPSPRSSSCGQSFPPFFHAELKALSLWHVRTGPGTIARQKGKPYLKKWIEDDWSILMRYLLDKEMTQNRRTCKLTLHVGGHNTFWLVTPTLICTKRWHVALSLDMPWLISFPLSTARQIKLVDLQPHHKHLGSFATVRVHSTNFDFIHSLKRWTQNVQSIIIYNILNKGQ